MTPLREEMIKRLELERMSPNTQRAYLWAVEGLAKHYWRPPDQIRIGEVETYLHLLLVKRKLSWSSCNIAACGIAFFFTKVLDWPGFSAELPPRKLEKRLPEVKHPE